MTKPHTPELLKPHEGIYAFADCPNRNEKIRTRREVLVGGDWNSGLCPNTCPMSPRNSDYSICEHKSLNNKSVEVKACRLGGTAFNTGTGLYQAQWCEAIVAMKQCPRGYVR